MKKLSKKQIWKKSSKKCYFCEENDYNLLDVHRIKEGKSYNINNILVLCTLCHRKVHSGRIKIIGNHLCTNGKNVIIYIEDGVEKIK